MNVIKVADINICTDNDYDWESKAFVVEKLGSSSFVYLESKNEPVVVECPGDSSIKVGDVVKVKFDFNKVSIFDENKNNILKLIS